MRGCGMTENMYAHFFYEGHAAFYVGGDWLRLCPYEGEAADAWLAGWAAAEVDWYGLRYEEDEDDLA